MLQSLSFRSNRRPILHLAPLYDDYAINDSTSHHQTHHCLFGQSRLAEGSRRRPTRRKGKSIIAQRTRISHFKTPRKEKEFFLRASSSACLAYCLSRQISYKDFMTSFSCGSRQKALRRQCSAESNCLSSRYALPIRQTTLRLLGSTSSTNRHCSIQPCILPNFKQQSDRFFLDASCSSLITFSISVSEVICGTSWSNLLRMSLRQTAASEYRPCLMCSLARALRSQSWSIPLPIQSLDYRKQHQQPTISSDLLVKREERRIRERTRCSARRPRRVDSSRRSRSMREEGEGGGMGRDGSAVDFVYVGAGGEGRGGSVLTALSSIFLVSASRTDPSVYLVSCTLRCFSSSSSCKKMSFGLYSRRSKDLVLHSLLRTCPRRSSGVCGGSSWCQRGESRDLLVSRRRLSLLSREMEGLRGQGNLISSMGLRQVSSISSYRILAGNRLFLEPWPSPQSSFLSLSFSAAKNCTFSFSIYNQSP